MSTDPGAKWLGGPPTAPAEEAWQPRRSLPEAAIRRATDLLARAALDLGALSDLDGSGIVGQFESTFALASGGEYAVATSSGTAALFIALTAAGIGPDDDVIVSTYGWGSTAAAVLAVGGRPVFGDIDESGCLCPAAVERVLSPSTRAIVATHMLGNVADVQALSQVARARGLVLIFDAAQGFGATMDGIGAGGLGDYVCFSLGRGKSLSVGEPR